MSKKKVYLTEEKAKRIAVGATIGGVLLCFFLFVVLIIQFIQIGVKNSELNKLNEEQQRYETLINDRDNGLAPTLDFYKTEQGMYYLARKDGWK